MLAKNPLLEEICSQFEQAPLDWPDLVSFFQKTECYKRRNYNENTLHHDLARLHLRQFFCQAARRSPLVSFSNIPNGTKTPHYLFCTKQGRPVIQRIGVTGEAGPVYGTIDLLVMVDRLPVLWKIKLSRQKRYRTGKNSASRHDDKGALLSRRDHPNGFGYQQVLQDDYIRFLNAPVLDYFIHKGLSSLTSLPSAFLPSSPPPPSCGYVAVLYPEVISSASTVQQHFREQNGIILPWPMPAQEYRAKVAEIARQYQLLPREKCWQRPSGNGKRGERVLSW